jgi:hypothetical protein
MFYSKKQRRVHDEQIDKLLKIIVKPIRIIVEILISDLNCTALNFSIGYIYQMKRIMVLFIILFGTL